MSVLSLAAPANAAAGSWVDTTTTDFNAGTSSGVAVDSTGGGQVSVPSVTDTNFDGTTIPTGWTNELWDPSGTTAVSSGKVTLNGTKIGTNTMYSPGQRVDVVAKFSGAASQFVGLSQQAAAESSAGFDTVEGGTLYAYVDGATRTAIAGSWFNAYHTYRVDWSYDHVDYYIDGTFKTTIAIPHGLLLRPVVTDGVVDSGSLLVDSYKLVPLADVTNNTFSGTTIPAGWKAETYGAGGYSTVASSKVTNELSRVYTNQGYNAGQRIDFLAKFGGGESQYVGMGDEGISESFPSFRTLGGGNIYAAMDGSNYQLIAGSWFSAFHTYRIDWKETTADFYIDGVYKTTLTVPTGVVFRPIFGDGSADGSTLIVDSVALQPLTDAPSTEFSGTSVPTGWSSEQWFPTGTTSVSGGQVTMEGTRVATDIVYNAGQRADISANFGGGASQFIGFSRLGYSEMSPGFDTVEGGALYAYVDGATRTAIPGSWFGNFHTYRVDWKASQVDYYIDGTYETTIAIPANFSGRPMVEDGYLDSNNLVVDYFHTSSLAGSGTYTSRVFDTGTSSDWSNMSWTSSNPTNGILTASYRTGNTSTPDGTWTAFQPVASSGSGISGTARYAQYQFALGRSPMNVTPTLSDVTLTYHGNYLD